MSHAGTRHLPAALLFCSASTRGVSWSGFGCIRAPRHFSEEFQLHTRQVRERIGRLFDTTEPNPKTCTNILETHNPLIISCPRFWAILKRSRKVEPRTI